MKALIVVCLAYMLVSCGDNKDVYEYTYAKFEQVFDSLQVNYQSVIEKELKDIEASFEPKINNAIKDYTGISKECFDKIFDTRMTLLKISSAYADYFEVIDVNSMIEIAECDSISFNDSIGYLLYDEYINSAVEYRNSLEAKRDSQYVFIRNNYTDSILANISLNKNDFERLMEIKNNPKFDKNKTLKEILGSK